MTADVVEASPSGPTWTRAALALASGRRTVRLARGVTLAAAAVEVGRKAHRQVRDRLLYTVTVPASDELYEPASRWLVDAVPSAKRRTLLAVVGRAAGQHGLVAEPQSDGPTRARGGLEQHLDGASAQWVRIAGHRVQVEVAEGQLPPGVTVNLNTDSGWLRPTRRLVFRCYGQAARDAVLAHLGRLAADHDAARANREPRVYIARRWGDWDRMNDTPSRSLDTVVLADGQRERIVDDVDAFLAAEALYARVGIPWHRGYLFHGPPGTGKTSLARALATRFGFDVYYVPLSDLEADTNLVSLLGRIGARSMLVLEDIDVVHGARVRDDAETKGVSTSGLLNALDGLTTPHGLVTVMTTNDLSALDRALVRPGRADLVEELGRLDDDQASRLASLVFDRPVKLCLGGREATHAELLETVKPHLADPPNAWTALVDWCPDAQFGDAHGEAMSLYGGGLVDPGTLYLVGDESVR